MIDQVTKLLIEGKPQEAKAILERALLECLDDPKAFVSLADAFIDLKEYDKSLKASARAIQLDPQNADALRLKGFALLLQGKYFEASPPLRDSLNLSPFHPETLRLVGGCFYGMGLKKGAFDFFQSSIDSLPGYLPTYIDYVQCLLESGENEKALSLAEEVAEMYPENPEANSLLVLAGSKEVKKLT